MHRDKSMQPIIQIDHKHQVSLKNRYKPIQHRREI